MTNHDVADARRAATLIAHYATGNTEGCNYVLREANAQNRVTPLIEALLSVYGTVVPLLHSEVGVAAIRACIAKLAMREENEQ